MSLFLPSLLHQKGNKDILASPFPRPLSQGSLVLCFSWFPLLLMKKEVMGSSKSQRGVLTHRGGSVPITSESLCSDHTREILETETFTNLPYKIRLG